MELERELSPSPQVGTCLHCACDDERLWLAPAALFGTAQRVASRRRSRQPTKRKAVMTGCVVVRMPRCATAKLHLLRNGDVAGQALATYDILRDEAATQRA